MRILIVEDFSALRLSLVQGLQEAGFSVDSAADGQAGLWQAQACAYDVIVLDLMLPKMDGMTVLNRLRADGIASHVLILTARDTPQDRVNGLDGGADDYLVKPFNFAEFLARIRALVRRTYQTKNPILCIGDLEIDSTLRLVRRGGQPVTLTPREYALLEFLALRRGQVVSRTEIWEHVYDNLDESTSNVVDVRIGCLRKKLDLPHLRPLIHTRRGHGYILSEDA